MSENLSFQDYHSVSFTLTSVLINLAKSCLQMKLRTRR